MGIARRLFNVIKKRLHLFFITFEQSDTQYLLLVRQFRTISVLSLIIFFSQATQFVYAEQQETNIGGDATSTSLIEEQSYTNLYPIEGIPAMAGVVGDFIVGPGKVDVTLKPGQSKIVEITVANRTGEKRIFNLVPEDAGGSQDSRTPIVLLGDVRGPYSLKDYLSVPYNRFELDHNQKARIPVTISIPEDAQPGGLYGSMLVNTIAVEQTKSDEAGTVPQSAVVARIGTLFFITVPGSVEKEGSLKEFGTIPKKSFFQNGPINFGVLFENTGSIHLAPYAELRIKNMFDEEVGYLALEPWFVLPKAVRLREFSWNREMLFGRYTATIAVNRSYNDKIDEMSYTFWVLPWKPIVGAFVGLFLVIFLIRAFFKNFEFKRK